MKKLLAIVLTLVFCLSLVACGGDKESTEDAVSDLVNSFIDDVNDTLNTDSQIQASLPTNSDAENSSAADAVAEYVAENKDDYIDGLMAGFEESNINVTGDLIAKGTGVIFNVNFEDLDAVTADEKANVQANLDSMQASFDAVLAEMKAECAEITSITVNYCEFDGDVIGSIVAE